MFLTIGGDEYSILSGDNFGRWRFLFLPIGYPCRGKWLFGWGYFYPYVTPAGAKGILGGVYSIHTKPLPGQMAFWVGFILSIRNPCRGKWLFGCDYFCDHNRESTHRIPLPGQMAFWVGFIFCGHNRESTHRIPLPGQKAF